jgi:hypothetical protein
MASTTGSSALGNLDWSKFDFTRWNLSGLSLDPTSSTIVTALQKVMAAPQWPQAFGSNLPTFKTAVIQHLTLQIQTLQTSSAALDTELATRTAATQSQITALQGKVRQASVPPTLTANPNQFQLVAKAVDQQTQLGLPGLTVQLSDPSDPATAIATATTDTSGNAILSLSRQKAASLAKEKAGDLTLTILNSAGKSLYSAANAVCAHPNQVETQIAAIPSSADTAPALQIATQQSTRNTTLLNSLTTKLDQLKVVYASRKAAIQTQVTQIQSIIAAIQAELNAPANP